MNAVESQKRESKRAKQPSLRRMADLDSAREAITYYRALQDREEDHAPLSLRLIKRISVYTRPYAAQRNWLFFLTFARGIQLPILAWMIGNTINGPIARRDLPGIYLHSAIYGALVFLMIFTLHFRQRLALGLGEAVAHDMRSELFRKLMSMPMSFFNRTKFGRIISRMTSDIDSIREIYPHFFTGAICGQNTATTNDPESFRS